MPGEPQRIGLWLYRQAFRLGLLSSRPVQRLFTLAYFAYKRRFEDPFYNLTRRHPEFFRGGHVIDVGANIGYTACVFADALEKPYRVWAFEPAAENFNRLEATVAGNSRMSRITPIRSAVGDTVGEATVALNQLHPGDHRIDDAPGAGDGPTERVPMTTVDATVTEREISPVAFVKVDVQGYELKVCEGMTRTLSSNPGAVIVVEYFPSSLREYGAEPRELTGFFSRRGYSAYRLSSNGTLEPIDGENPPEDLPAPGYIDVLFARTASETLS